MIRRILFITLVVLGSCMGIWAQDTYVVKQFGDNLANWASSRNTFSALESMERLTSSNPAFRVGDNIMATLAYKNNLARTSTYNWDNYIACLQKEIDNGVDIKFSNIKSVPESLIEKKYKDVSYVSCNIKMQGGETNFNENDLFVLKNGKIVKIQEYQEIVDKKGRRRLKVDLEDFELYDDTEGVGINYNYSKAFPLGFSINYSKWKFMVSADFGINFDKDVYTTQKVDFKNLMDYRITKGEYDPKFYFTVTPAFYLRYFSVGWGFGALMMKGNEKTYERDYTEDASGSITVSNGSETSGAENVKFMMRPNVKGFIPCSDNFYITLSVSYNWVMGYKKKNGVDFGVGVQYVLD